MTKPEPTELEIIDAQLDAAQHRGIARLAEIPGNTMIFWWRMGTGKTRIALHAFWRSDFSDLIVVCRRISFDDWLNEMDICGMPFVTYQNDYKPTSLRKVSPFYKGKKKHILLVSAGDLKSVPIQFPKGQMIVVDELYLFANPKAKRSILLKQVSLFCRARLGLSGTIMPARNNMAIFGQLMALNEHRLLASGSTEFQKKFQSQGRGRFGRVSTNRPGSDIEIAEILKDVVDVYMPESRPTRKQIVKVDKSGEQTRAIKKLKEEYRWNDRDYQYALQIVNVVNGISNGWWVHTNGDLEGYKSPKVDKLMALLEEILSDPDAKVVVWCAYHNDITRIASEIPYEWIEFTARIPFDRARWAKGDVRVVLATEANGASVNHFKHVKYAIYFSINFKLLDLEQSMMRHERKGSEHDGAHYYFLQTKGTGDARAYQLVTSSKESEESLVIALASEIFK